MKCDRCRMTVETGEERAYHGQTLCEDCYMDALSPPQGCDPWAVYMATRTPSEKDGSKIEVSDVQALILNTIQEDGEIEREVLFEKLQGQIEPSDLKRELATLRHMEKVRGEPKDGKVFLKLW